MGRKYSTSMAVVLVVAALLALVPRAEAQGAGARAAATENSLATRAAISVMRAGGNAIDGAVAAVLVGGVASPTSSGIGGGGFAMVWLAAEHRAVVLDFREVAPAGIDVAAFERRPLPDSERGKLVGVPGEVAGLWQLHERFGKAAWKDVVAPAVRHATQGYPVGRFLAGSLASNAKHLRIDPGISSVFYPGGKPAAVGQLIRRPALGATLSRIAAEGPKAFYEGKVAAAVAQAAQSAGGALTTKDLAAYRPTERKPIHVRWEGYDVYTMPPPSAGGMMLAQTLQLFSKAELTRLGMHSGAYQHVLAEAMRGAVSDRMRFLGDPAKQPADLAALVSPARMKKRKQRIAIDRTHTLPRFDLDEHGTHHLVTADDAGNVVSLTTTVNRTFGAKLSAKSVGVVLNDQLDDFTAKGDVAPFGLSQSPNRARPGAKPVSSMTPTVVARDGKAVLALGGSGGTTIATNVTQLVLSSLAFGLSPSKAVRERRFYVPNSRATILLEKGAPKKLQEDLRWRGEIVAPMPFTSSAVQILSLDGAKRQAASDPRKLGEALVR